MSSVDIYIVVEGQTEQTFIRDVLAPELAPQKIYLYPVLIGIPGHKGGDVRFDRAKDDIGLFLKQRENIYISTLFDYFRINKNWPGKTIIRQQIQRGTTLSAGQKAEILETATLEEIVKIFPGFNAESRFIPYIQMHELEALLFSDTDILAEKIDIAMSQIQEILNDYEGPEEINDDPVKAPSKRLETLMPGYRKVALGKTISEAIGIQTIRNQCPHFDAWITKLENL
jgi:hypothetical protein